MGLPLDHQNGRTERWSGVSPKPLRTGPSHVIRLGTGGSTHVKADAS